MGCIVVMGSGVADAIRRLKSVRKKIALTGRVKGELQYFHTGEMEVLAQGIDFVGNNAQIFSYDRN